MSMSDQYEPEQDTAEAEQPAQTPEHGQQLVKLTDIQYDVAGRVFRPTNLGQAYRMGKAAVEAGVTQYGTTPTTAMIMIQHGMEIGMKPMQALQRIAVINNRPCLYGDAVPGLVYSSGICEYMREWYEGTLDDGTLTAWCEAKRKNNPHPIVNSYSIADAKRAMLWDKRGKNGAATQWQLNPPRMLKMRARGFTLRDGFADVLGGFYLVEEMDDEIRVTAPSAPEIMTPPPIPAGEPIKEPEKGAPIDVAVAETAKPQRAKGEPRTNKPYSERAKPPIEDAVIVEIGVVPIPDHPAPPFSNDEAEAHLEDLRERYKQAPTLDDVVAVHQEHLEFSAHRMLRPDLVKAADLYEAARTRFEP